jgi:hypothetical protein
MLNASNYWISSSRDQVLMQRSLCRPWQLCPNCPVHITGIHRHFPYKLRCRVCRIWGLPLTMWRNLVLCYMTKLVPQLIRTSWGAVFHPTLCNRYKMNSTASQAIGMLFTNFYYDLILTCCISFVVDCLLPSWYIDNFNLQSLTNICLCISPLFYGTPFCLSRLHSCVYLWIVQGSSSCAFIYEDQVFSFHLHS